MARCNNFHPFCSVQNEGPKKKHHSSTTCGKTTPNRFRRGTYNIRTGKFNGRIDQQVSGDEITFSVGSIDELAQHSYSHVIRICLRSFRRPGEWKVKSLFGVSKRKGLLGAK